jgi:hypothetical protein
MSDYKLLYNNQSGQIFLKKTNQCNDTYEDNTPDYLKYNKSFEDLYNSNSKSYQFDDLKRNQFDDLKRNQSDDLKRNQFDDLKRNQFDDLKRNQSDQQVEISFYQFFNKLKSMNLIGPEGPPGPRGLPGAKGEQGPSGNILYRKSLLYGIKKLIPSENNRTDFRIGINKNHIENSIVFDTFYLPPNVMEINSRIETNYINEKKVECFMNKNNKRDVQFFPLDYVPSGSIIPFKKEIKKIKINNFYWNIIQSIDLNKYKGFRDSNNLEILAIVPEKERFTYEAVKFQINIEIHSQINDIDSQILPYKNNKIKENNPGNTCLFTIQSFKIDKLQGINEQDIIIEIPKNLNIDTGILAVRVSIPSENVHVLRGYNKNADIAYGFIPFNQFLINFDYELL